MNLRSRMTGIATGDQAMFVTRAAFDDVGGFPPIALMEDVALSARLKRMSRPLCLRARVDHLGAALARARRPAHDPADVAVAARLSSSAPIRRCWRAHYGYAARRALN